ncbi:MAG: homoserine O-acetyltransferase, partial [Acidimicrobiia bacterium]|nr:homoserine O-acetyltransferase [Acidimicrobiia bacterium]
EGGGTLHDIVVEVRTWGRHRSNATLVCHALTGDANADEWWNPLFGKGCVLDPSTMYVVAMNVLGGCNGTTGPTSVDPATSDLYGSSFPSITIRDMVRLQRAVIDALGVTELDLIIGGSMGGMVVLEWAACYPEFVARIVPIAVGPSQSPWAVGFSEAQRNAIVSDPGFLDGNYRPDAPPAGGLSTARMIAMLSYRSAGEFRTRFGRAEDDDGFAVQSYLRYQGDKLVDRFDANSYLRLIEAMDSHDLGRGRGPIEAILRRISAQALVVGISSDVLYPVSEVRALAGAIPNARFAVLDSPYGHDGFLVDAEALNRLVLTQFADRSLESAAPGRGAAWA